MRKNKKKKEPPAVAVLPEMWDWSDLPTSAGYKETAPPWFKINPHNVVGGRLYNWLGHDRLLVTNVCSELASSAKGRGKPNPTWLQTNLEAIRDKWGISQLLVCGNVAQSTFECVPVDFGCRVLFLPHPAARSWTARSLQFIQTVVQDGESNLHLQFQGSRLVARPLLVYSDLTPF